MPEEVNTLPVLPAASEPGRVVSASIAGALYLIQRPDGSRALCFPWDVAPQPEMARMSLFERERKRL